MVEEFKKAIMEEYEIINLDLMKYFFDIHV